MRYKRSEVLKFDEESFFNYFLKFAKNENPKGNYNSKTCKNCSGTNKIIWNVNVLIEVT